ncbi:Spermidine N(1)-acetyltransferase [uncultured archaeon]|nr:Spermidine N(1)-acetyltransferase [uncultured archaeon]
MVSIREIGVMEEEAVACLLNCNFPHVGMTRAKLRARIGRGAVFLVAVSNGNLIGFVDLVFRNSAVLRGVVVKEGFRGKGVGSALVSAAVRKAVEKGALKIRLKVRKSNKSAIRTYRENGFFVKREGFDALGEPIYFMEKRLAT